jgi:hypothetical protein
MRYDPAANVSSLPRANTGRHALHLPVSTLRMGDREGVMSRQAAELDVWEDEGGTTAGHAPEFPSRHMGRHFDEFSG